MDRHDIRDAVRDGRFLGLHQDGTVTMRIRLFPVVGHIKTQAFVPLEAAIRMHLDDLFPGLSISHAAAFRVTRDSEFELDEDVEDLLEDLEGALIGL